MANFKNLLVLIMLGGLVFLAGRVFKAETSILGKSQVKDQIVFKTDPSRKFTFSHLNQAPILQRKSENFSAFHKYHEGAATENGLAPNGEIEDNLDNVDLKKPSSVSPAQLFKSQQTFEEKKNYLQSLIDQEEYNQVIQISMFMLEEANKYWAFRNNKQTPIDQNITESFRLGIISMGVLSTKLQHFRPAAFENYQRIIINEEIPMNLRREAHAWLTKIVPTGQPLEAMFPKLRGKLNNF